MDATQSTEGMREISVYDAAQMLLINKTAAYYAVLVAAMVAPFYVFVIDPLLAALFQYASRNDLCGRCRHGVASAFGAIPLPSMRNRKPNKKKRSAVEQLLEEAKEQQVAGGDDDGNDAVDLVMPHYQNTSPMRPSGGSRRPSATRESGLFSTPESVVSPARRSTGTAAAAAAARPAQDPFLHTDDDDDENEEESFVEPSSPSTRVESDLAIYGQPLKLAVPLRSRDAGEGGGRPRPRHAFRASGHGPVDAAFANGEVYYHPANRVLSIENKIRLMFARHRRCTRYHDSNITEQALQGLFREPKFQRWYDDNHDDLLDGVRVRRNGLVLRCLSSFAVMLTCLCALPAFSFSNKTWASLPFPPSSSSSSSSSNNKRNSGWGDFKRLPPGTPLSQATFLQLLVRRADYLREGRGGGRGVLPAAITAHLPRALLDGSFRMVNSAELVMLSVAVCALLTSTFMPRGRRITAVTALWALAAVLLECSMAGGAGESVVVQLGLGVGVAFGLVAANVAAALR